MMNITLATPWPLSPFPFSNVVARGQGEEIIIKSLARFEKLPLR